MEDVYRKVGAEVEALNIELDAPARIRVVEDAVPPLAIRMKLCRIRFIRSPNRRKKA